MNAYDLAEIVDKWAYSESAEYLTDAANMLRQQADRIAHLEMLLANRNEIIDKLDLTTPQTKPLSDEEINEIKTLMEINYGCVPPLEFAWAIEKRHGIK